MGVGRRTGSGANYLSIYGGSIVREWRKSKPKDEYVPAGFELKERELTKGKNAGSSVWFIEYDYLEGMVTKLELREGKFGEEILVTVDDVGDEYVLTIKADSSHGRDFLMKLPNIDFTQPVSLEPWSMTAEAYSELTGREVSSDRSGLTVRQGEGEDGKVSKYYTKDNPNGLPELEKKTTRKGVTWDGTAQMDFLLDTFEKFISKFNKGGTSETTEEAPKKKRATKKQPAGAKEDDDLPW